ncbi:MAG: hypothetical protein ABW166_14055 [Sedimenticola sp.]
MKRLFFLWFVIAALLVGCMSAQEIRDQRIFEQQAIFNNFPDDVQSAVRQGHIDIGFNRDMVMIAWGAPDQVLTRRVKDKNTTIWVYTQTLSHPNMDRMRVPVSSVDAQGEVHISYRNVWVNWSTHEVVDVARVEFTHGRVSAIEQVSR